MVNDTTNDYSTEKKEWINWGKIEVKGELFGNSL